MANLFSGKIKTAFSIYLAILFAFLFLPQAEAYLAPGMFVTQLAIEEVEDYGIKGQFTVWNSEQYYMADLNYAIKLFQGTDFYELKLIDAKVDEEMFFLGPNQKVTKSFFYQYPKNIISGDYTVRAQIMTERGSELGWKDEIVSLQGQNRFLEMDFSSSKILIKGEEFRPLTGEIISPGESVTAVFKVKNLGEEITATPRIKIFQRKFNMPLVMEYEEDSITFNKAETKEIALEMPKFDAPESYLAEIKFYEGNEQISGILYFRWVLEGEGGKIMYVKADKDSYRAGEIMEITVVSVGPADWADIGSGKLEIIVYDRNGDIFAQVSEEVVLNPNITSSIITIPVKKHLISPRIEARLVKDGNIFDEREIELPVFSEEAKQLEKEIEEWEKIKKLLIYLIPIITALLAVTVFSIYKLKTRKKL